MKYAIKKGFTLIELLVVITIIGILATGAVTTFTSQIQKARDTTRISDVKAMQGGIEQVYQDASEYPDATNFFTAVSDYVQKFPSDPKHAEPCNDGGTAANATDCAYAYRVGADSNGILLGDYEISTAFENKGNVAKKAEVDGGGSGIETTRLELGNDLTNVTAVAKDAVTPGDGACAVGGAAGADGTIVIINGNPTSGECS